MGRTLLRGAAVIDGTGSPSVSADVLISGDRIAAVARPGGIDPEQADRVADLTGLTLMPGFIDAHAHSDDAALLAETDTSKTAQGVTTEVNGNCGFTLAPIDPGRTEEFRSLVRRIFPDHEWSWSSMAGFIDRAAESGWPTNFATLIGHNTLRIAAMGLEERAPTRQERLAMHRWLDAALAGGAAGLSTGLVYPPGVFSATSEIVELASALPPSAVYASHMRNEGQHLMRSLEETLAVAQRAGVRCHLSHLKVADRRRWGTMGEVLEHLEEHRAQGLRITQDIYPYTAASTMLTALLPPWMQAGGSGPLQQRLRSAGCREQVRAQIGDPRADFENYALAAGWEGIILSSSGSGRYDGMSLDAVAQVREQDPVDCLADLLLEEELRATMIMHIMCEDDVRAALADPRTMIGSDGLPLGAGGRPHPRGFGSFVRILDTYVGRGVLTAEEAVRRMTSLVADTFSLPERGRLRSGCFADLVAVDLAAVEDRATYAAPRTPPRGVEHVWINGEPVIQEGIPTHRRPGRMLRARHH